MNTSAKTVCKSPRAHDKSGVSVHGLRAFVLLLALLSYAMLYVDLITTMQGFAVYTLLLLGYIYMETRSLWKKGVEYFWINPVVLSSVLTFVLGFGITNLIYFMPEGFFSVLKLEVGATPWMDKLMLLVVLGACSMWAGYGSAAGCKMGEWFKESRLLNRFMTTSTRVNLRAIYFCLVISLLARLLEIKLGVYGYSSDYDQLIAGANYREYLSMADSLGKLALVGSAIQCFAQQRPQRRDSLLLGTIVVYEVAFGFLSGFKSQVVMPFITLAIVHYSQRNRFPKWLLPAVVVSVMAAYAVIEPFRKARYADLGFVGTDIASIAATMTNAERSGSGTGAAGSSTALAVLSRLNLTWIASLGIEYAATHKLPPDSPDFLGNLILAPAHAVIPRFLWRSKPLENTGLWYTNQVMGVDIVSASGMSPFTYLNFAGGPLAVIIGFFIVGVFQRGLFDGLLHFGGGGMIVFLGLLSIIGTIDSAFNGFFVGIIRYLPVLVVVQYVLLKRSVKAES